MRSRRSCILSLILASLALAFVPLAAAAPLAVHIEVLTMLPPAGVDAFAATGDAVDGGVLCATGVVTTGPVLWSSPSNGQTGFAILRMVKYFVCDDGGTFDVNLTARVDLSTGNTTGQWRVLSGTGSYAGLKGHGTLVGLYDPITNSVLDIYGGKLK